MVSPGPFIENGYNLVRAEGATRVFCREEPDVLHIGYINRGDYNLGTLPNGRFSEHIPPPVIIDQVEWQHERITVEETAEILQDLWR